MGFDPGLVTLTLNQVARMFPQNNPFAIPEIVTTPDLASSRVGGRRCW
jgi:hypothetical protein